MQAWLLAQPRETLEQHARFAAAAHARITLKLGFLAGGADKIALIPLLVLILVQMKVFQDFAAVPAWQVYVGLFAGITYVIALVGHLMKLRLHLYESILSEAVRRRDVIAGGGPSAQAT